jgi:Xaa-Pro aminopeptidase
MSAELAITTEEFQDRLDRTQAAAEAQRLDGLIAISSYAEREGHVCYLSNHRISFPNVMSHTGLGYAAFVAGLESDGILVSPLGYQQDQVVGVETAETGPNLVDGIRSAVSKKGLEKGRIGIAGLDVLPVEYYRSLAKTFPDATFENAGALLEDQRLIKTAAELKILRAAAGVADRALEAGMEAVRAGATEHDVELAAREAALAAGADFVVRVRVSSGKRIFSLNWPMVSGRELEEGDLVYLDFIGWFENYGFNNSRVTVVGTPNNRQREYLDHLVDALEWMIEVIEPHREVMFPYTQSRGREIFPFGHGIGLEICENPWLTTGQTVQIEPGMVICLEPSVQSPELGRISLEDTVVVTASGIEVLNQCPRAFWG